MDRIAVTGGWGPVGLAFRAAWPDAAGLVLLPPEPPDEELVGLLRGADAVVDLAWAELPAPASAPGSADATVALRRLLSAMDRAGVGAFVHLSSALTYGAWADNPIPLTEEAPLVPNPGATEATAHAAAERLVAEWADEHPGVPVAVLRPATTVATRPRGWLTDALTVPGRLRSNRLDPPRQFVHVDDVAAAVAVAVDRRLDGVYNVAADGSLTGDVFRALAARWSVAVPDRVARAESWLAWRLHVSPVPPRLRPWLEQPWVVANDRLRAAGWAPRFTNEEALVAGRPAGRWRELNPTRRQQVALAGATGGLALLVAAVAVGVTAIRRRRSPLH